MPPIGREAVIRIGEGPTAADRHETRVAVLREDHTQHPSARIWPSAESYGNDDWRSWLLRTREARPSKISGSISAGLRSRSQLRLRRAPWTISAFRADALMASPSWKSMARTDLLSKRVLKSPFGSFSWAPFGNVSRTAFLRASPMQTMPSWDQTGTPSGREGFFHFTSSITPGSAPLMRARSWLNLSPLQPAILRTMSSICWDADASLIPTLCCGWLAPSGPKG